jgi:hypothetical protein
MWVGIPLINAEFAITVLAPAFTPTYSYIAIDAVKQSEDEHDAFKDC